MSTSDKPASEERLADTGEDEEVQDRVDGIVGGAAAGLPGGASPAGYENDDLPASDSDEDSSRSES